MTTINCAGSEAYKSNTLKYINVDNCKSLNYLYVGDNLLTKLDVTHNPELKVLSCNNNKLTSLDLSNNKELTKLYVGRNTGLTKLDLTNNSMLTLLSADGDNIPELNVSNMTNLSTLYCSSNKLKTLDLSNNLKLSSLYCYNNQIDTLDLSKQDKLTVLDCNSNRLKSLTISSVAAPNMTFLNASKNALAYMDLSKFTKLGKKIINSTVASQHRREMIFTDPNETYTYLKVGDGISTASISGAKMTVNGVSTDLSADKAADGTVVLKLQKGSARTRMFNWMSNKATVATITYNYNTAAALPSAKTMDVTDTVECYLLPMSQQYGSVNLPYDALLPEGATAYAISETNSEAGTATLTEIAGAGDIVAANTPMLIKRSDDSYTLFAFNQSTGTTKSPENNLLKGTQDAAVKATDNDYVLGLNSASGSPNYGKLGFWRSAHNVIGNWRAYLQLTSSAASSAKGFMLSLDATTTGISMIAAPQADNDTPWYTLDGTVLRDAPTARGIYIHNGKKMVVGK